MDGALVVENIMGKPLEQLEVVKKSRSNVLPDCVLDGPVPLRVEMSRADDVEHRLGAGALVLAESRHQCNESSQKQQNN